MCPFKRDRAFGFPCRAVVQVAIKCLIPGKFIPRSTLAHNSVRDALGNTSKRQCIRRPPPKQRSRECATEAVTATSLTLPRACLYPWLPLLLPGIQECITHLIPYHEISKLFGFPAATGIIARGVANRIFAADLIQLG